MPKIVDHAERRRTIARAAASEIARLGLTEVTLVGIGKAAGVTTGAVSHYFDSKDALIDAALQLANDRMQARVVAGLASDEPVVAALLGVMPTDEESRVDWLVWGVFAERASRDPALREAYRELDDAWVRFIRDVLVGLRDAGKIPADHDLETEAAVLVSLAEGLGGRAATDPEAWDRARLEAVLRHYLAGLAA